MVFKESEYHPYDFANRRHIGPSPSEMAEMLRAVGAESLDALIEETVPEDIRAKEPLEFGPALSEQAALHRLRLTARKNRVLTSLIGQGYYGTVTPPVIQRNIFENPAWYTAYTPYQPEISPGAAGGAAQLPDDGLRPDRARRGERVAARRGDGGGGGDGALPAGGEVEGAGLLRGPGLPSADDRRDPHAGGAVRLGGDRRRSVRGPGAGAGVRGDLPVSGDLWRRATTSPGRSRRCTRRTRWPAWRRIRWR